MDSTEFEMRVRLANSHTSPCRTPGSKHDGPCHWHTYVGHNNHREFWVTKCVTCRKIISPDESQAHEPTESNFMLSYYRKFVVGGGTRDK